MLASPSRARSRDTPDTVGTESTQHVPKSTAFEVYDLVRRSTESSELGYGHLTQTEHGSWARQREGPALMEPSRLCANYLRALLTNHEIPHEAKKNARKATAATHISGRTRESLPAGFPSNPIGNDALAERLCGGRHLGCRARLMRNKKAGPTCWWVPLQRSRELVSRRSLRA